MTQNMTPLAPKPSPGVPPQARPMPMQVMPSPVQPGGVPMPRPQPIPNPGAGPGIAAGAGQGGAMPRAMPQATTPQAATPHYHSPGGLPPMPPAQPSPQSHSMPYNDVPPMNSGAHAGVPGAMPYEAPYVEPVKDGGERALPSISIQAFCDRSETANLVHEMSRDWRMRRANLKIFMGGLPAAVEFYQKESTPGLIVVESGMRGDELFAQLEQLASVCDEGTKVIIIGATNDIKLYRKLIDQGVSDYVVPPFHPLNLIRSISELFNDPEKPFVGRVCAFFGAKGGVGSSTLAHNTAWALSETIQQETALIDLDASWGTTGLDFAYDATEGLEEALSEPKRLDETLLDRLMLRHTSKLSILPSSSSLGHNPISSPEAFETVVNGVRAISPMTILDMPHQWTEWSRNVLVSADDIVITAVPDLANLRNTKNLIDYLASERPNDSAPILILNKTGMTKTHEISVRDFGAAVGIDPALVIGYDPDTFIEAANDGKMLTDMKSAASAVQGLNYIATRLKTGHFQTQGGASGRGGKSDLGKFGLGTATGLLSKIRGK